MQNKENEKIELNERDIKVYYNLANHINILSQNIGILGTYEKYRKYINTIIKRYTGRQDVQILKSKTSVRIIDRGLETNFIWINTLEQLYNKTFKKYV